MSAALRNDYPERKAFGHCLFNWLEDARLRQRVHAQLPKDEPYVSELYQASLAQMEQVYEHRHHEQPWTPTPRDEDAQLRIALAERIYAGDRGSDVSSRVAAIVNDVAPLIERATAALNTNDAREGALEIIDHLAKLRPPLHRQNRSRGGAKRPVPMRKLKVKLSKSARRRLAKARRHR
jgi:hypothetical protein